MVEPAHLVVGSYLTYAVNSRAFPPRADFDQIQAGEFEIIADEADG